MKSLEGYFDNLAAAAVNEKYVLGKLVANNAKLAAANKEVVTIVKKLSNEIKNLERETSRLKKTGGQGKRYPNFSPHCKNRGIMQMKHAFRL